ncbi:MAG: YfiR family protein [Cyclobacteriaceae bacterium]
MKKTLVFFAFVLLTTSTFGQSQNFMYSVYMFSFAKYVQWPPEESQGDFEITVLGESPALPELKAMADKKKANGIRTIRVTKISSLAEYKKCHVLYVAPDWTSKYAEVSFENWRFPRPHCDRPGCWG